MSSSLAFSCYNNGSFSHDRNVTFNLEGFHTTIDLYSKNGVAEGFECVTENSSTAAYSISQQLIIDCWDAKMNLVAENGKAYGVNSLAKKGYSYNSTSVSIVSIGDITGYINAYGKQGAMGIYSSTEDDAKRESTISIGNIVGEMNIKSKEGNAFGFFSSDELTITGNISGQLAFASEDKRGVFITGIRTTLNGGVDGNGHTKAMEISGSIIVDGGSGAYGILASGDSMVTITGIVAAGEFNTMSSDDGLETLVSHLQGFNRAEWYGKTIISQANGIAYADGYLARVLGQLFESGTFTATSSADTLSIESGAVVMGDIALGGGANTLTIDTGAQIYGDITGDSIALTFNVATNMGNAVVTARNAGAFADESTNWTINVADGITSGVYSLADIANGIDASALEGKTVTVNAFGEHREIAFGEGITGDGLFDVGVTANGEIEFVYADTFFGLHSDVKNGYITKENNGSFTLSFSRRIDAASFDIGMVSIKDGKGNAVAVTECVVDGNKLVVNYEPLTQDGIYTVFVSSELKDVDGNYLDQNLNKTGNEADDGFSVSLRADFTSPYITRIQPDDTFDGTLTAITITFASEIDIDSVKDQIVLVTPSNTLVLPTKIRQVVGNVVEVLVPEQTAHGTYRVQIGNGIKDQAGNYIDQNRNGIGGEAEDACIHTFRIADVELRVGNVELSNAAPELGETFRVSWTDYNENGKEITGSWTDGVYLSTDARWDIGDKLLGKVVHDGGLAAGQTLASSLDISLSGALPGDYYLLVRSDIYMQEQGNHTAADAAQNLEAVRLTVTVPRLATAVASTDSVSGTGDFDTFIYSQAANVEQTLLFESGSSSRFDVYVGYGFAPTREKYSFVSRDIKSSGSLVLNANAAVRDVYVMVYARNASSQSEYSLTVQEPQTSIVSINTAPQSAQDDAFYEITGINFGTDTTIALRAADGTLFEPTALTAATSSSRLQDKRLKREAMMFALPRADVQSWRKTLCSSLTARELN